MSYNENFISNLSKDKYTIKARSTQTISFLGGSPNYYKIANGGKTSIYLGVSMMPTEHFFDEKIPAESSKLYVDAYGRKEVYIYNPSWEDTNIIITSFSAPFEPSVLALSGIGQDFANIELSGKFDATGNLETALETLVDAIPRLSNTNIVTNINNNIVPDIRTIKGLITNIDSNTKDYTNSFNNLSTDASSIKDSNNNIKEILESVKTYLENTYEIENNYTPMLMSIRDTLNNQKNVIIRQETNTAEEITLKMTYIELFSNDSDSDIVLKINNVNFTLKANETLKKIHFTRQINITIPANASFRVMGS